MILRFINRAPELKALESAYCSKGAELFVIYGRRRIGKTELIKNFSKNKKHFYFLAKQQKINIELERFREKFAERFNIYLTKAKEWETLFREILEKINLKEKLIIIIDEFPYWIAKNEVIVSEFQYLWDEVLKKENIFLILSGSYVGMMEEKVLAHKSPLYGRRTGQLKIEPMEIKHLPDFLPRYNVENLIKIYGAVGTIPFYLNEMHDKISFEENIQNTFWNKANILNQEARILLREELKEVDVYFNILKAIIDGATRTTEIASKSRVDITNINKYLNILINLRLIKKEKPITATAKEKKYIYMLHDNYFRFWLSYVYPYEGELEENPTFLLGLLKKNYRNYLGYIFEDFCRKMLRKLNIHFIKLGVEIGKWWHKDKEIDIIALDGLNKKILLGECKWKDKVNAKKIIKELAEKSKYVNWNNEKRVESYAVFAKSFSRRIKEFEGKKVYCFDLMDLEKALRK